MHKENKEASSSSTLEAEPLAAPEEDEEVNWDLANDQFKDYFSKTYEPKVLITSADNPHSKTISFVKEMTRVIPNAAPFWRKNSSIKKMVKKAIENNYTDIVVVNEDNRINIKGSLVAAN